MNQWPQPGEAIMPPFGGQQMPLQQPGPAAVLAPGLAAVKQPSNPVASPRAPGVMQPIRLTPAARQEYEEYMRSRLAIGQQPGPRGVATPLGAMGPPGQPTIHTTITQGVCSDLLLCVLVV